MQYASRKLYTNDSFIGEYLVNPFIDELLQHTHGVKHWDRIAQKLGVSGNSAISVLTEWTQKKYNIHHLVEAIAASDGGNNLRAAIALKNKLQYNRLQYHTYTRNKHNEFEPALYSSTTGPVFQKTLCKRTSVSTAVPHPSIPPISTSNPALEGSLPTSPASSTSSVSDHEMAELPCTGIKKVDISKKRQLYSQTIPNSRSLQKHAKPQKRPYSSKTLSTKPLTQPPHPAPIGQVYNLSMLCPSDKIRFNLHGKIQSLFHVEPGKWRIIAQQFLTPSEQEKITSKSQLNDTEKMKYVLDTLCFQTNCTLKETLLKVKKAINVLHARKEDAQTAMNFITMLLDQAAHPLHAVFQNRIYSTSRCETEAQQKHRFIMHEIVLATQPLDKTEYNRLCHHLVIELPTAVQETLVLLLQQSKTPLWNIREILIFLIKNSQFTEDKIEDIIKNACEWQDVPCSLVNTLCDKMRSLKRTYTSHNTL